ncbi:MAG: type II toxin-antitoxin system Phd/YefM family antitoxin, partial [Planctomycetota bacterium]
MAKDTPNLHGLDSLSIADARATLSEVVGRARHGKSPTVLTSRGKPVAAVVPIEDLEIIEEAIDIRLAADARSRIRRGEIAIP